ncbi:MAG TPA: hypothetical protein VHH88_00355 [Verrucomicrobiae bacterium]|nr:hypothetical protein [Verrucomicrobiae bacterium]
MKTIAKATLMLAALGMSAWMLGAQDASGPGNGQPAPAESGGPGGPQGRHHRPPPPIIAALDANHDGVIDEAEIANASAALKSLDKNGDGKLTMDEVMPPRPGGPRGERGRGHQGPPPDNGAGGQQQ